MVFQRLPAVFRLQVGILREDTWHLLALRDQIEDQGYRDTHVAQARLSTHDMPVEGDSIQMRQQDMFSTTAAVVTRIIPRALTVLPEDTRSAYSASA